MTERVLILDFGAQYTQLIARRIRERGVYCEIHPCTVDDADARVRASSRHPVRRPASTTEAGAPRAPEAVFKLGVPVLGICYGEQTIVRPARRQGRDRPPPRVRPRRHRGGGRLRAVRGRLPVGARDAGLDEPRRQGGRRCRRAFGCVATRGRLAVRGDRRRRSAASTACSSIPRSCTRRAARELLANFSVRGRRLRRRLDDGARFATTPSRAIREQVGEGRVICGLSGGVDSSVAAVLLHEAVGEQLTCIFVDTGLLRAGEAEQVVELFRDHFNMPLHPCRRRRDLFLERLDGHHRSREQAQDHRQDLHRRVRARGQQARRRRLPGAGHALSGRDRSGLVQGARASRSSRTTTSAACRSG